MALLKSGRQPALAHKSLFEVFVWPSDLPHVAESKPQWCLFCGSVGNGNLSYFGGPSCPLDLFPQADTFGENKKKAGVGPPRHCRDKVG